MKGLMKMARSLESLLNEVDYTFMNDGYVPSEAALIFISFIKLVNGAQGEENKSPVIHADMLDTVNSNDSNLFVAFRGSAKTSLLHEYMYLYLGVYGEFFGFGEVDVAMYISDTIDNGIKSMRKNLEFRYNNSEFLQQHIVKASFTDVRWEFENTSGHRFCVRGFGASTGVRGFKEYGKRPTWCHAKGTEITTDFGTHLVEDYQGTVLPLRKEIGLDIKLAGLPVIETVTREHMYWVKDIVTKRSKQYLTTGTKSNTTYTPTDDAWVHAENLGVGTKLGNQRKLSSWIASSIERRIEPIQPIPYLTKEITSRDSAGYILAYKPVYELREHPKMQYDEFWWMYGLWLADGSRSEKGLQFYIADTERSTVGEKLQQCFNILGYTSSKEAQRSGCYEVGISDRNLSRYLKQYKRGNSVKDIPEWVMLIEPSKQKQLLLGYIAGDGYIDYKNNQVRVNSVNLDVLKQLGGIAERLNLPYHIRNTKKAGKTIFPNGTCCNTQRQWEIRFRHDVKEVLGFNIENVLGSRKHEVFIEGDFIYRKVLKTTPSKLTEFVPIQTPTRMYTSLFGLSHNCGMDDLMSDKNAESATITKDITNIVYKAARQAMHPKKRKIVWTGTPFNQRDPLYAAAGSKAWATRTYPICEQYPCTREDFVGAWEDRFGYDFVKKEYDDLLENGQIAGFNQELMLRISSDEDRLVQDSDVRWYARQSVLDNQSAFNFYITTDFATSEQASADYSVICVFAYDYKGNWYWVDGVCKRQTMDKNIDDLFRLAQMYSPQQVGVEVSGQQGGFIPWIQREMLSRNIHFSLASDNNSGKLGIRPNTSKLVRFNTILPEFKLGRIYLPECMRDTPIIQETLNELFLVTGQGMKSKHDDIVDTFSMLSALTPWKPSQEVPMSQGDKSDVYATDFVDDDDDALMSYIV